MIGFSGFKTQKNKTYGYTPRYWSERKERLEKIKAKYENRSDAEYVNMPRRTSFRDDWKTERTKGDGTKRRIIILVLVIGLSFIAYYAMQKFNVVQYL